MFESTFTDIKQILNVIDHPAQVGLTLGDRVEKCLEEVHAKAERYAHIEAILAELVACAQEMQNSQPIVKALTGKP